MLGYRGPAQPSPTLGDALNAAGDATNNGTPKHADRASEGADRAAK